MKFAASFSAFALFLSHPVRGAWIEILDIGGAVNGVLVAPREGCVD